MLRHESCPLRTVSLHKVPSALLIKVIIPGLKAIKLINTCLITCISLLIGKPSLRLTQGWIENRLYITKWYWPLKTNV